jgi:hypothetical protein
MLRSGSNSDLKQRGKAQVPRRDGAARGRLNLDVPEFEFPPDRSPAIVALKLSCFQMPVCPGSSPAMRTAAIRRNHDPQRGSWNVGFQEAAMLISMSDMLNRAAVHAAACVSRLRVMSAGCAKCPVSGRKIGSGRSRWVINVSSSLANELPLGVESCG